MFRYLWSFKNSSIQTGSLKILVVRSLFWATLLPFSTRLLSFIRTIILARILIPNDFGLFGLGFTIITLFDTFTAPGLQDAIIQKKNERDKDLNTAWTFYILRGILVAIALSLTYPLFAKYFNEPLVEKMLPFLSLCFIFKGFSNIGIAYFQKDLEFQKRFFYLFIGALFDVIISIILAILLKNFWALVWSCITSEFAMMVLSYVFSPYRPKLYFKVNILKDLLKFGMWIWGLGIISFFIFRADKFIISKILGTSALGFYIMATRFADITALNIGRVFSTVMFPAYSKIQNDVSRLKNAFLTNLEIILFISLQITIIFVFLAPEVVRFVLGEKWLPSIGPLRILALASLIRAIITPCSSLLKGIGKPKIEFVLSFIRAVITFVLAILLTRIWGITGTAIAILLGVVTTYPIWIYLTMRLIELNFKFIFKKIQPIIFGGILMIINLILFKKYIHINLLYHFVFVILISTVLFIVPSLYAWRSLNNGPFFTIFQLISNK